MPERTEVICIGRAGTACRVILRMDTMKVGFISLGCAKNQVNCEQMIWQTYEAGHEVALGAEDCDVAVVNTCGFLKEARDEALAEIEKLAELKAQGRLGKIVVTGCMAQWWEDTIEEVCPAADLVHAGVPVGILVFQDCGFGKVEAQHGNVEPHIEQEQQETGDRHSQDLPAPVVLFLTDLRHQRFGIYDIFAYSA